MKSLSRWLIAAAATVGSVLVLSGTAVAATGQSGAALSLAVQPVSANSVNLALSAQVGSGAAGQKVTFFIQTQEFSSHGWMAVGSSTTNSAGAASYTYTPTWTGAELFGAALGSSNSVSAPSVVKSFQVLKDPPGVPQSVIEYSRPLGSTGGVFVKSILGVLALVWVLLLGSLALVVWRMPRLAGASVDSGRKVRD
ncbi:MAG: hypothetical protein EPN30_08830 [Actinomycetota bacterium]|nr:MAG: hypothetical protein EPN30_08830 [Actinomycetota bacterium]